MDMSNLIWFVYAFYGKRRNGRTEGAREGESEVCRTRSLDYAEKGCRLDVIAVFNPSYTSVCMRKKTRIGSLRYQHINMQYEHSYIFVVSILTCEILPLPRKRKEKKKRDGRNKLEPPLSN